MEIDNLTFISLVVMVQVGHSDIGNTIIIKINNCHTLAVHLKLLYCYGVTIGQFHFTRTNNTNVIFFFSSGTCRCFFHVLAVINNDIVHNYTDIAFCCVGLISIRGFLNSV